MGIRQFKFLNQNKISITDLIKDINLDDISLGTELSSERLKNLLGRGVSLGISISSLESNNVWIISYSDNDYPKLYKQKFSTKSPPLLYGIGPKKLLNDGGISIVGSRFFL